MEITVQMTVAGKTDAGTVALTGSSMMTGTVGMTINNAALAVLAKVGQKFEFTVKGPQ